MKAIRWISASAIVNLQLGDNPVLEITDSNGNEVIFNVTQEDLEGISDVLTDGKYELEKVKRKKREDLEELEKRRAGFKLGVIGGVSIDEMLKNAAAEIKAKLEGESTTAAKCTGDCGMSYCDDNGCLERERNLVEPISETREEYQKRMSVAISEKGKEESDG